MPKNIRFEQQQSWLGNFRCCLKHFEFCTKKNNGSLVIFDPSPSLKITYSLSNVFVPCFFCNIVKTKHNIEENSSINKWSQIVQPSVQDQRTKSNNTVVNKVKRNERNVNLYRVCARLRPCSTKLSWQSPALGKKLFSFYYLTEIVDSISYLLRTEAFGQSNQF